MNRRRFLLGLLALPLVGPALASAAQRVPTYFIGIDHALGLDTTNIIAATIEGRSQQIADNVCRDNLLLRHVERDWSRMRPFKVGDEVYVGGKVLVCTQGGTSSHTRWKEA